MYEFEQNTFLLLSCFHVLLYVIGVIIINSKSPTSLAK